jgi:hypothetical protein
MDAEPNPIVGQLAGKLALELANYDELTTGERLRRIVTALTEAYDAGNRQGFARGFTTGQTHLATAVEMVTKAFGER